MLPAAHRTVPGYELLEEIGRGGMGVVYRARDVQLDRDVAVKLLRDDVPDESHVYTRFRIEARITGQLQHPGIPAVHELGALENGKPFLAMKLVKGQTLQKLLETRDQPQNDRGRYIAIFEQICHAVGFAHVHGVLHRDLKPSNIMVGRFGEVQVMDWGLAKVLGDTSLIEVEDRQDQFSTAAYVSGLQDTTVTVGSATRTGSVLGTPAYMPPEQAGGEIRKLDARSDVFGLGAILCQILTGQPPYVGINSNDARIKAVRGDLEDAYERLDACGAEPDIVSLCKRCLAFRQEDRPADGRVVAEEVEKIRTQAEARARQAELAREAAQVRMAEERKRRQQFKLAAGGIAAVLLLGIIGTSIGYWRSTIATKAERQAKDEAKIKQQEAEAQTARAEAGEKLAGERLALLEVEKKHVEQQRLKAEREKEIAQAVRDFLLTKLLRQADVYFQANTLAARGAASELARQNPTICELLDRAAEELTEAKIEANFPRQPELQAKILQTMGNTYGGVGDYQRAVGYLERSRRLLIQQLGPEHPDTLRCMHDLAYSYLNDGKPSLAQPLFEETLRLTKASLGDDHVLTQTSMNGLASTYWSVRKLDKAAPLFEEALNLMKKHLGVEHPNTLTAMNGLGAVYVDAGKFNQALPLLEEALKLSKEALGKEHPSTLVTMNNLAMAYRNVRKPESAIPLYEESLKQMKVRLGADHPNTLAVTDGLAVAYLDTGKTDRALPLLEKNLTLKKAQLGDEHPQTLVAMNNLALAYHSAGKLDLAVPLFEKTLKLLKEKVGVDHHDTLITMNALAMAYDQAGKRELSLPLLEEAMKLAKAKLGNEHPHTLLTMTGLAHTYLNTAKPALAIPIFEEILKLRKAKLGAEHPLTLDSMSHLARAWWSMKRLDQSVPIFEEVLRLREKQLGRQHAATQAAVANLGVNYRDAGRLAEALPLLEEAYQTSKIQTTLGWVRHALIDAYIQAGKREVAVKLMLEPLGEARKQLPEGSAALADQLTNLGYEMLQRKLFINAEPLLRESLVIYEKQVPDDWRTFHVHALLGTTLLGQKKAIEAKPFLLQGYEGMKVRENTIPPGNKTCLAESLDRLIELHIALNQPDEEAKWKAEKLKLSHR